MATTGKSNSGNVSNDRQKAADAGKKGGQASGGNNAADGQSKASDSKSSDKKGGAGRKS